MSQAEEQDEALSPEDEAALLGALEAALRPEPLDPALNERLLQLALEDPLAPASAEELVESARLRDALSGGAPHEAAALLSALRAPFAEAPADTASVEAALGRALGASPQKRSNVVYARFGVVGAALAAAAAVALLLTQPQRMAPPASADASSLVKPHSTEDLFADRFETRATSARMDLIASVRGRDLRDNRYAAWGVR
ncbi:MAG TPA: hypothetical protein VEQ58_19945 [Polyangiaceae bacterium]|nr:hypothetical protein [Polyangiaceae bacterium]